MVERYGYVPQRGDIVWMNFTPQTGHEQKGCRPALVLSAKTYNSRTGLGLFCPVTSKAKGYVFEVPIAIDGIQGVVLTDAVKSQDWQTRDVSFVAKASAETLDAVTRKLADLIRGNDPCFT